ncbi:MAG: hypothetical protein ACRYFW_17575 [Janthinobacterium lividum]
MSDVATTGGDTFRLRTVAILVAVGIAGFVGMLVMGAYAPDLRSGRNGGAHALSDAAVGYAGLVRLAEATGRHPRIVRDEHDFGRDDLLVITPETGTVDVGKPLQRIGKPTLVVLPKWQTARDPDHDGWVRYAGLLPSFVPEGVLAPATRLHVAQHRSGGRPLVVAPTMGAIALNAPRPLQVITHSDPIPAVRGATGPTGLLRPLITDGAGGIVLAQVDDGVEYVLSDPDLLSNQGIRDPRQAAAALAILDWLNVNQPSGVDFDVTLNGLGHGRSPLRLAFDPPFLAMTLALAAVLLLAGLHATARFGPVRPPVRAIAFGKAALVDNTAALVRRAGRQGIMGARYAAVVRERARTRFGIPARVGGEALDAALDRLPGRSRFTDLAAAAGDARRPADMLAAARALDDWQEKRS